MHFSQQEQKKKIRHQKTAILFVQIILLSKPK